MGAASDSETPAAPAISGHACHMRSPNCARKSEISAFSPVPPLPSFFQSSGLCVLTPVRLRPRIHRGGSERIYAEPASSPYARACTVARPRGHRIHTDPARCARRRHIATLAPDLVPRPDADRAASFPWRTASRLYRPARSHGQPSLGAAPRTSWPPTYLLAGHTSMSVISRGNLPRLLATCC